MRGRLAEVPHDPADTEIDTIRARVEVVGEGLLPTQAYANLENNAFLTLDLGKNLYPFGKEPRSTASCTSRADELAADRRRLISIEMLLADSSVIPRPNPSEQLVLAFEYYDGKRWRHLGRSAPRGALPGSGDELGFHDEPRRCRSPHGQLPAPQGQEALEINGQAKRWIRVRIEKGDYGESGTYTLENEKWIFRTTASSAAGPALDHAALSRGLSRREALVVVQRLPVHRRDRGGAHRVHDLPAVPGQAGGVAGAVPRVRGQATQRSARLYFSLDEELGLGSLPTDEAEIATPSSTSTRP